MPAEAGIHSEAIAVCGKTPQRVIAQRSNLAFNKIDNFEIASSRPLLAMTLLTEFFRKLIDQKAELFRIVDSRFPGMTNFALIVTRVPRGKEGLPEKTVTDA